MFRADNIQKAIRLILCVIAPCFDKFLSRSSNQLFSRLVRFSRPVKPYTPITTIQIVRRPMCNYQNTTHNLLPFDGAVPAVLFLES